MENKGPLINEEEEKLSVGSASDTIIQRKSTEEVPEVATDEKVEESKKEDLSSIIQRKTTDEPEKKEEEKTEVKVEDIVIPDFNNEEKVEETPAENKEETPIISEPTVNPEPVEEAVVKKAEEQVEHKEEVKEENEEEIKDDLVVAPVEENNEVVESEEKFKGTSNIASYIVTGILTVFVLYLLYVTSLGLFYGFKYKDYTPANNQTETQP